MATPRHHQHGLAVKLNPGDYAPRYDTDVPYCKVSAVVITEQGTESGLPIIDFQLENPETGGKAFTVLTGRQVLALAAMIRGVNLRNHGKEEP